MRATTILSLLGTAAAAASNHKKVAYKREQFERELSGSGDISYDDDFWAYDEASMDVVWDDYSLMPKKCMI